MKKTTLVLNVLAVVTAVGITVTACMPRAHAAPVGQSHLANDVALSATPDDASLEPQLRVDFVPQRGNHTPPFMGRLIAYRAGQAQPVDVIAVRVHVALEDLQLSMPDLDGDGHSDLVFSAVRDRAYQRQADAVYLWSAPRGRFVLNRDLSRLGSVYPSTGAPGCVMAETWCGDTSVGAMALCRKPGTELWVKSQNQHTDCAERD